MINIDLKLLDLSNQVSIQHTLIHESKEWSSIEQNFLPEKVGFLNKRIIGAFPKEEVYFFKNCNLKIFNGRLELISNLDGMPVIVSDNILLTGIWSTSLYLSFMGKRLFKIVIQIMGDRKYINWSLVKFVNEIITLHGEPNTKKKNKLIWRHPECELRITEQSVFDSFHAMLTYF